MQCFLNFETEDAWLNSPNKFGIKQQHESSSERNARFVSDFMKFHELHTSSLDFMLSLYVSLILYLFYLHAHTLFYIVDNKTCGAFHEFKVVASLEHLNFQFFAYTYLVNSLMPDA